MHLRVEGHEDPWDCLHKTINTTYAQKTTEIAKPAANCCSLLGKLVEEDIPAFAKRALDHVFDRIKEAAGKGAIVNMGTDCSGIESPLIATHILAKAATKQTLPLRIRHRFSCDNNPQCQDYIRRHCKPDFMFADLLQRKWRAGSCFCIDIQSEPHSRVRLPMDLDLYVAGFPCTPFSRRHSGSECFREDAARVSCS